MATDDKLSIRVVLAFSDQQQQVRLELPLGSTARQAVIQAVGEGLNLSGLDLKDPQTLPIGVFGEQVGEDYVLVDDDRVEIYRALIQSPMELRRQRAAAQKNR